MMTEYITVSMAVRLSLGYVVKKLGSLMIYEGTEGIKLASVELPYSDYDSRIGIDNYSDKIKPHLNRMVQQLANAKASLPLPMDEDGVKKVRYSMDGVSMRGTLEGNYLKLEVAYR